MVLCSWSCPPAGGAETSKRNKIHKDDQWTEAYDKHTVSLRLLQVTYSFFNLSSECPEILMMILEDDQHPFATFSWEAYCAHFPFSAKNPLMMRTFELCQALKYEKMK